MSNLAGFSNVETEARTEQRLAHNFMEPHRLLSEGQMFLCYSTGAPGRYPPAEVS